MNSGVYEIVNLVNGKRYVGSSVHMPARWTAHQRLLRRGGHHSLKLQRAWNKYGAGAFQFNPIIVCARSRDALLTYEGACFKAFNPEYNICRDPRSRLGVPHSVEARAKISAAGMGRRPTLGMKLGSGPKLSAALKGRAKPPRTVEHTARIHTPLTHAKISAALMGNKICLGHKHTADSKANMSAAAIGNQRRLGQTHRPETIEKMRAAWVRRKARQQ